ncbi:hypothetical protein JR316_0010212 [Psilocybe cubensis]|uniref:DUF4336 domain-containing protein n=2 Tax=Psilocybe cubensis TaxID=181762 RepID=A0A8H7XPS7_PSICU|nr:hypothetical protein JR316_0010212 [Psilocybe cubensis]KAH9477979.1 hypothetical protein JR316_0010212 [Psilocybe cubensis]
MSSETVIREVTKGVWTFSKPFARFGIWPMGGRSTAIQLSNGGVWILASTPLDSETKSKLEELGPIKYIIGADAVHHLFLSEYKKAYPTAKLIAPEATITNHPNKELVFDGVWGRDPQDTKYGFEDDIEHWSDNDTPILGIEYLLIWISSSYFSGFKNKDVAFLHKPSKSLIEADLLMNLPGNEQYSKAKQKPQWFRFNVSPASTWIYPKLIWSLGEDKEAMRRDAKTVSGWDFDRIIPCHGDVIETNGKKAWNDVYKSFLD